MYQITDGTFREAQRYCIHEHAVVEDGPWYAMRSCWFNSLYTRVVPSHAVELTSALLDRRVAGTRLSRAGQRDEARLRGAPRRRLTAGLPRGAPQFPEPQLV